MTEQDKHDALWLALADSSAYISPLSTEPDDVRRRAEALRVAREFEPHIAIIDIRMPHMWGDELIARFKRGEAPCPKDFIVFTAKDDQEERNKAAETGYKFLSKQVKLEDLIQVLNKTCVKLHLLRRKT